MQMQGGSLPRRFAADPLLYYISISDDEYMQSAMTLYETQEHDKSFSVHFI